MPNHNFSNLNSVFLTPQPSNSGFTTSNQSSVSFNGEIYNFGGVINENYKDPRAQSLTVSSLSFQDSSWVFANSASGNKWEIGTRSPNNNSANSAYIINPAGNVGYTETVSSRSFLYRTVQFVPNTTRATISFSLYVNGETGYDGVTIWVAPENITPVASTSSNSITSNALSGATRLLSVTSGSSVRTLDIPTSLLTANFRIIFEWSNDATGGAFIGSNPGAYITNAQVSFYGQINGNSIGTAISNATKYNIANNSWTTLANIPSSGAKNGLKQCQIFSQSNMVYLFGGIRDDGTISDKNYRYNSVTNTYSEMAAPPNNTYYLAGSSFATLQSQNITYFYMLGGVNFSSGFNGVTTSTRIVRYRPDTNTWDEITVPSYNAPLFGISCVINNRLYFTLGSNGDLNSSLSHTLCEFDPETNSIQTYASLSLTDVDPAFLSASTIDNDIFLNYDTFVYKFNIFTKDLLKINGLLKKRNGASAFGIINNIYFINGEENRSVERYKVDNLILYNGASNFENFAMPTWTQRSSTISANSVAWSKQYGVFSAVTSNGASFSYNGTTWSASVAPAGDWASVTFSPAAFRFVAVAPSGSNRVMTSSNGVNWSAVGGSSSYVSRSVCWSPEREIFVAVGTNQIISSTTGLIWNVRSTMAGAFSSVCWSPERSLFVAVASSGTNLVATSPDGVTWTARTPATTTTAWLSVCWSPQRDMFVAVGTSGLSSAVIMTSPDGITWTARYTAIANINSVVWSQERELFIASQTTNQNVLMSTDGINWYSQASFPVSRTINALCWSPDRDMFVAVGTNYVSSSPLHGWSMKSALAPTTFTGQWVSVCWSTEKNLFVAVGNDGTNRLMTSSDGINWKTRPVPAMSNWQSVCWSPEKSLFVAVAFGGAGQIMTSPDGITWSLRSVPEANQWWSVCWSKERNIFVAVAQSGTNRVMTSADGFTWTARSAPASQWLSVCWSPERSLFVAVAIGGTNLVMTSPDGLTWTARSASEPNLWNSVCWSPERSLFVAVASSVTGAGTNRVMTSSDGITWTARSISADFWQEVCWVKELGLFIAVGESGSNRAATSTDGINWTTRALSASGTWMSVCWSPILSLAVAVGYGGTTTRIATSVTGLSWTSTGRIATGSVLSPVNTWVVGSNGAVGTPPAAYITTDGNTRGYTVSARYNYLYKKFTLPAFTTASLSFTCSILGEPSFDGLAVYVIEDGNAQIPSFFVGNTASYSSASIPGVTATRLDRFTSTSTSVTLNTNKTLTLPTTLSNKTFIVAFQWINDASGGGGTNAGVTIDNVNITYANRSN